jgi:uncharacterized caspase-like protein
MADNKIALVIGNGAYAHASRLENPANDARAIAATLTRIGFSGLSNDSTLASPGTNKVVTPLMDLDYGGLRRALAAFARAADDVDQAVLYYAGHGIEVSGQNYLIPVDARLEHVKDVEFETASMMQVLNAVGGEGASGLRLIILDACRDNPFRSRLFATRDLTRGLRAVEPGRNILVAYAAKHGTVALDGDGSNSPYAKALMQHLEQPGLEIMDLFREVKDTVLETTGHRQEPYLYGSLGRRREYFVQPLTVAPKSPPDLEPGTIVEHTYWMDVKDTSDPEDLEQFITKFPNGNYLPLARRNIERLINSCSDKAVLLRLVADHPDSPRAALARARIMLIEAGEQADVTHAKPFPAMQDEEKEQRPPKWPERIEAEMPKEQPGSEARKQALELSRSSRMILDFLLLFYSPSWKLVLLIGACSVTLGVLTQQVETLSWRPLGIGQSLQLHTGFIFALALVLCLRLSGARDFKKLLTIAVGATAIWPVTTNLVSAVGRQIYLRWDVADEVFALLGGAAGGCVGAIAVSALVQFCFEGKIGIRVLIIAILACSREAWCLSTWRLHRTRRHVIFGSALRRGS